MGKKTVTSSCDTSKSDNYCIALSLASHLYVNHTQNIVCVAYLYVWKWHQCTFQYGLIFIFCFMCTIDIFLLLFPFTLIYPPSIPLTSHPSYRWPNPSSHLEQPWVGQGLWRVGYKAQHRSHHRNQCEASQEDGGRSQESQELGSGNRTARAHPLWLFLYWFDFCFWHRYL